MARTSGRTNKQPVAATCTEEPTNSNHPKAPAESDEPMVADVDTVGANTTPAVNPATAATTTPDTHNLAGIAVATSVEDPCA
jgi:hypothetical protein